LEPAEEMTTNERLPCGEFIHQPVDLPVGRIDLALQRRLDVGRLLRRQAFVEVHTIGSLLDQADHAVVASAVGRVGEVDGVGGEEFVRSLSRKSPDPMTLWLNGHKRACQFFVRIRCQHSTKFTVNSVLCRGKYAQVKDSCSEQLHEDQCAKIPVPCDENPSLFLRHTQQLLISRARQPQP
jgi:hypothetical protein